MNADDFSGKSFLDELYRQTKGDLAARVSMYNVGATLGLSKSESASLAESLMVENLVELKTLAGGIGITSDGLAILGVTAVTHVATNQTLCFSNGPLATDQDRRMIEQIVKQIKDSLSGHTVAYDYLEEIVIDLKTIDLHMLSPRPKIAVLRALLRSLHEALVAADIKQTATMLNPLIN